MGVFYNLGLGFEVPGVVRCVDDLTLQRDLDKEAPAKPGWYRLVSDEVRLLELARRHCQAGAPIEEVLDPLARLFGSTTTAASGLIRLADEEGRPVAMAAPLPGERERACELITPPMGEEREALLGRLLEGARDQGFVPAVEGATHIHLDAAHLRDPARLQTFARGWLELEPSLPRNHHHRRVGPWSEELSMVLFSADFADLPWPVAAARLRGVTTKYCDLNLRGLAHGGPTVELRVLPAMLDHEVILEVAERFSAL